MTFHDSWPADLIAFFPILIDIRDDASNIVKVALVVG